MNKSIFFIFVALLISLSSNFVNADEDFDPSKWARFNVFCNSECGEDEHRVITLEVGACQSWSSHCGDSSPSINIMTTYNTTTQQYSFTGSSPSDAQCTTLTHEMQTVNMYQCFHFMNLTDWVELTVPNSSYKLSVSLFVFASILISLFI